MHYLITGGAGFIGTHLAKRLLHEYNRVTILDNMSTGRADRLLDTKANVIVGTVTDGELVSSLVADCDYIIHLACVVGVRLAMNRGCETLRLSYVGTENVLEAATKYNKDIFVASSSAIYGKINSFPVSEEEDSLLGASTKISWLYSVGKLMEEHLALAYFRERGTRIKIARFFNVIGPYQTGSYGMVVPTFISKALNGEPLPVYEHGLQTRTFCYIEDMLDGLEVVLQKGEVGGIYNIGGRNEISILELAKKIIALTDSSSPIHFVPFSSAFGPNFEETSRRIPDITRLQELGYRPRYSLDESLSEIISHYRRSDHCVD
ncbi:MAG: NAD-dependent epimerase/dehydratase family protein [Clostridiales bacterium]|jgi:UDP-glucose 4-epimerase|nr:NAD-dependent epimerase/dehydratase family protein [Clostridiales bacterium]